MALVILNMLAMPWHQLFTAQHPETKQRLPFKVKSRYENMKEKSFPGMQGTFFLPPSS